MFLRTQTSFETGTQIRTMSCSTCMEQCCNSLQLNIPQEPTTCGHRLVLQLYSSLCCTTSAISGREVGWQSDRQIRDIIVRSCSHEAEQTSWGKNLLNVQIFCKLQIKKKALQVSPELQKLSYDKIQDKRDYPASLNTPNRLTSKGIPTKMECLINIGKLICKNMR